MLFVIIILTVLSLTNWYIYRRFFRQLTPRMHRPGAWLMGTIMAGELLFIADRITGLIPDSLIFFQIMSSFIGATFMLFVVALIYDLVITTSKRVPFDQERRRTLKVVFDIAMLIGAASYLWHGFRQGTKPPQVKDVVVNIKDFPTNGYTIVQLTDVHVGRTIKRDFVVELVQRTNAMQPDLVVITGDLVDMHPQRIAADLEPLKTLQAPTYFVPGNHEYFHGVEVILAHLKGLNITPLTNQNVLLKEGFYLVGLNDLFGRRFGKHPPDVKEAYQGVDAQRPVIVLAHQPKLIEECEAQRCDLMLSGHTHGGQIFPFGALVKLAQPYLAGLYTHKPGQQIYVSRGTGYWGPPLRVLAPSEITRLVITRA
uniref:Putative integral membrane protein with phosphohydrolyase domain n=1 Tax=Magnetococcus massalia (strain MO-1) TaxID=451514 RepID=A0A1S7LJV3_MAGMO|nr:Putative integral membrane protein with phosphohydrolyase domain [Candidatus Magnetococcus massalia]